MSFCMFGDVRSICDTDITDAEITNIITWADARIKMKIDTTSAPASLTAAEWTAFLEGLSATLAAYRCMLKDPNSEGLGEWRGDRGEVLKALKEEINEMFGAGGGGIAMQYHSESLPRW